MFFRVKFNKQNGLNVNFGENKAHNNRIQLTVKSVTFFAKQKSAPLFTASDAGVSLKKNQEVFS